MTRRTSKRKVMQKSAKTELGKYSAKYALSELLVCGECGTPYKRCTWARNGKKRIVWRCVSRLEFGKKYCHNSPTLDEEKLHRAILEAINEIAPNHSEAVSAVLDLINTVCSGTQDGRPSLLELKNRLAALTIQQSQVMEQVLEDMENTELNARLRALTEEKETLQMEIEATQADERQRTEQDIRMEELGTFLTNTSAQITEYEDEIVRKMIEKITVVDVETIRIRFKTLESEIEKKMV
jgi:hypothetical protein